MGTGGYGLRKPKEEKDYTFFTEKQKEELLKLYIKSQYRFKADQVQVVHTMADNGLKRIAFGPKQQFEQRANVHYFNNTALAFKDLKLQFNITILQNNLTKYIDNTEDYNKILTFLNNLH